MDGAKSKSLRIEEANLTPRSRKWSQRFELVFSHQYWIGEATPLYCSRVAETVAVLLSLEEWNNTLR